MTETPGAAFMRITWPLIYWAVGFLSGLTFDVVWNLIW